MRSAKEAVMLAIGIIAVSVTMSLVVTQCSKSEDEKRSESSPSDVSVLSYLQTQKKTISSRWEANHSRIISEEGYSDEDMPFKAGLVKFETSGKSCITNPIAYWEKRELDAKCVVTIYFDCHGNVIRHTSECIVYGH